ncbi:MAG: (Fe-S)-binding protein [Anaerolineae bacterium]|nr:(Fe-S)-binding protein [Anaerolineae bacterium]
MALLERPSPRGKRVSLFVTCLVDNLYPQTGLAALRILEHLGLEVDFPLAQTCCGQPGFNAGHRDEARTVARQFLRAFANSQVIVTPSGSCAAMVRHEYPALFADDPQALALAQRLAGITWELSEFIVDGLGIDDIGARLPEPRRFAFHDCCHGLRLLGLSSQARQLIGHVENAQLSELAESDSCCGFGGLFSVKMSEVSAAMLRRKMGHIKASDADDVLLGDVSCMMHINGGLARDGTSRRTRHFAEVLASALPDNAQVRED